MHFKILGIEGATSLELVNTATRNMSLEDLKACLVKTKLNKEQMQEILMNHGVAEAEAEQIAITLADTQAKMAATASTGALTTATGGLTAAFNGLKVAMASHPIGAIAVAAATLIGIVSTAITVFSGWSNNIEDVSNSANDLKNSSDDIDSYIREIKDLKTALNDDSISQSEATEKRKELLKIQEELIKKYGQEKDGIDSITEAIQGETEALDEIKKSNSRTWLRDHYQDIENANSYFNDTMSVTVGTLFDPVNLNGSLKNKIGSILNLKSLSTYDHLIHNGASDYQIMFRGTRDEIINDYDLMSDYIINYINQNNLSEDMKSSLSTILNQIKGAKDYLINNYDDNKAILDTGIKSVLESDETYSKLYSKYLKAQTDYEKAISENNQNLINQSYQKVEDAYQELFNNITYNVNNIDSEQIKQWVENLQNQFRLVNTETPVIIDVQTELEHSPDSYAKKIKEIAAKNNYTSADIDAIISKGDLGQTLSADEQTVYDSVKEYVDLWNSTAEAMGQSEIKAEEYIDVLEKLGIVQKTVAEGSESSFALSKDQTKELKSVHSDIDKLNKAYQNLFAGKLEDNEVYELIDLFPTLGNYVDMTDDKFGNLAEGIEQVIKERPKALLKQLESISTTGMSDEAVKSFESIKTALKGFHAELKTTDTLIEHLKNSFKGISSSIQSLQNFTKEIKDDGSLSLSSIDTILTDDTFISLRPYLNDMTKMQTAIDALMSKQKDAYEDLYNADLYESNYDSFHKAAQKITDENENAIFERIQEIEKEVKETEKQYQLDELNWDKLSVEKQNMFQNTNIELLSKQKKLIDDFNDLYNVDVTKFQNATDAKREILENFSKSKVMNEIRDLLNETDSLGRDNGSLFIADDNVKKTINDKLSIYGLTWADVLSQLNGTGFTPEGEKSLQSLPNSFFQSLVENNFESLLQPFKITTKQWEDIIKNSSGDSKSDTKQYFDWIERRLKKFADNTKRVFSKVKDYITFKGKNSQLLNAIKAIRDEIAVNEQSYNSYLSYANGVNLSEYYKNLVRNGSIDIEKITNKDLQEKINKYKEYYDNAMSCKDAIDSLKETEKEYAQQQLSNVEKYYSNRISYANADVEYYNSLDVDNLNKSKNYDAIRKSYNEQISYTQKEINDLTNTLNTLVSDGTIKYQSDEWYEWWGKIQKCNVEVRNLNKNIRDLADEELQDIQTFWDNRITKADSNVKYYNSLDTDNQKINKNYNLIRKSYNKQISYTEKQKEQLINTLNSMVKSGDIEEYSDKWYEWQGKIDDCNVSVRELKKSIHDLADEELQDIQTFWDNRIGVYDNTISYINTVGSDTTRKGSKNYKRLSSAYNSQIGYTNKQVSELQARLDKAVKAGDIEKYSDKWYEWTGIIEQGKEKVVQLQTNIHQLVVDEFNDIATRYDNLINRIEHKNNLLEESISQTQEKGYIVSTKYYNALITNEQNNISKLSGKRNDLYANLQQAIKSGNIQEGSEEWHKMVQEIENIDLEIAKANTSVIKFNNSIRDIQWQVFDLLQDKISQISAESNFLINLMKNDNLYVKKGQGAGQLTNQGLSTMGLHGVNYNVYMAQSNKYAQEISKIDKQLAKDPYNQTLINRRKELLKLQQDMIISANDEKQAIVSMVKDGIELELNALKELIDKYNEALDAQKDLYDYQKRIREQTKEITSLQKQLMAYTNDSSEETKAKVQQLKINLETAKENLQETQYDKFISDQKKLLDDLYDDYETILNQRLDNVNSLISDMIDNINNNADTIKQTLIDESGNVGYQISSTMNDIWNSGTKPVLSEYNTNFLNTSNNVISAINNLTNSINNMIIALDNTANKNTTVKTTSKQSTTTVKQTTPTNNSINKTNTNNSKNKTNTNSNKSTNSTSSGFSKGSTNNNSTQQNTNHKNTRTDKENYGVALAIINGNYGWGAGEVRKKNLTTKGFNYNTVQGIVNKLWKDGYVKTSAWKGKYYGISNLSPYHYNKYKQGQYSINHNQMAWTNENGNSEVIIRRSDGAILTPLAKDDMILSSQATDNLFSIATDPNTFIKESLFGSQNNAGTANINNVNNNCSVSVDTINFNLPNVKNYEDFFYAAQHDKRFEKMVQAMTVDKLFGGSSLKKYRV